MENKTKYIKTDRRSFLKGAAVAGGVAVAAPGAAVAAEPVQPIDPAPTTGKGYEENEYIRNYYNRARF